MKAQKIKILNQIATSFAIGLLALCNSAQADLVDYSDFIYDDVLDITWAQDAKMTGIGQQGVQINWADGLTLGGFDDWRLPNMDRNGDGTIVDCATATEEDCRDNEFGYLYHQNGVTNVDFMDIQDYYWSGTTDDTRRSARGWSIAMYNGTNNSDGQAVSRYAWAVRTGSPVPIPAAVWLFASALGALAWTQRRKSIAQSL